MAMSTDNRRVALVTGGASGFGRAIVHRLVADYRIVIADRDTTGLEREAAALREQGRTVLPCTVDVAVKQSVDEMREKVLAAWGRVDLLVNSAGICNVEDFFEITEESWDRMFAINTKGVFLCCQSFGKLMREEQSGVIINIASGAGIGPSPWTSHYGASKAAVLHITCTLATLLGKDHVRVNAILPGTSDTPLFKGLDEDYKRLFNRTYKEELERRTPNTPMGVLIDPEDIANMIAFLASDEARYITNQAITVG